MIKNYTLYYALFICFIANAQTINLLNDINSNGSSNVSLASEKSMIEFNGALYFTADDGTNGSELWKYDGTTTELFFDINPGSNGSDCDNFFVINDKLIFTADNGTNGVEWWVTDGIPENTQLVKDSYVGEDDGVFFFENSSLQYFMVFDDKIFFTGNDDTNGYELWSTDGTEEGTMLVKNIESDFSATFIVSSFPVDFAILNGELLFSCRDGLWKTDGTEAGTVEINSDLDPNDLVTLGDKIIFWNNSSIWTTDGTNEGTVQIKTLTRPSTNNSNEVAFTVIDDKAFFAGSDTTSGPELWITDGTETGTQLVLDAEPGTDGYAPQNKVVLNNKLYYKGDNGENGIELWTSDGTSDGTFMVKDINEGTGSGFTLPSEIYVANDFIYMSAGGGFNTNLWISDGTEAGTNEVIITDDGENKPSRFFAFNNGIFFFALNSNAIGTEPHFITEGNLSIHDVEVNSFTTYPNPTNDFVFIDNKNKTITSILITDVTGKLVDTIINTNETIIKLSLLKKESGIYLVTLNSSSSSVTKKIIKE